MQNRFMKLFQSNPRSFGQFFPSTSKMSTTKGEVSLPNFEAHLSGKTGVGCVAVLDDGTSYWGAIDIDNHSGEVIDHKVIVKTAYDKNFPLVVCESKSGGAHCYLFVKNPVKTSQIRSLLTHWASELGFQGAEVFPKQSKLLQDRETGEMQMGNWINLPYFNSDQRRAIQFYPDTNNYAKLGFSSFLDLAESTAIDQGKVDELLVADYPGIPPCLQSIIELGSESGSRNEAIYNLTIYMKKVYPDEYRDKIYDLNQHIFPRPLSFSEIKKTVSSASRREYKYKCMEEPCRSRCDADLCLTRKHGISKGDTPQSSLELSDLKVYATEPPTWEVSVSGKPLIVTTDQLYNHYMFVKTLLEKHFVVASPMKNKDWHPVLSELMEKLKKIEAPDDASTSGIIRQKLSEFFKKTDLAENGKDKSMRDQILRGIPVVQELDMKGKGGRYVVFKGTDFRSYLQRTKSEELKGSALWDALRKAGVKHTRIRISGKVIQVWCLEIDKHHRTPLDPEYGEDLKETGPSPRDNVAKFTSEF